MWAVKLFLEKYMITVLMFNIWYEFLDVFKNAWLIEPTIRHFCKSINGAVGVRTLGLSHAKRTRYHCATAPFCITFILFSYYFVFHICLLLLISILQLYFILNIYIHCMNDSNTPYIHLQLVSNHHIWHTNSLIEFIFKLVLININCWHSYYPIHCCSSV